MNWHLFFAQLSNAIPSRPHSSAGELATAFGVLGLVVVTCWSHSVAYGNSHAPEYERLRKEHDGVLFRKSLMNAGYWLLEPIGRTLHRRRIAPNTITAAGLVLAVTAAAAIVTGRLGLAGLALLGSALCDALDGMVARLGQSTSESGAAFDAITDRLEEIFVFSAIAFSARAVPWIAALSVSAMIVSLMNSYISAKAEVFRVQIPSGRMRRGERAAWVILGCLLVPIADLIGPIVHVSLSSSPLVICICAIAVGTAISASVRAVALVELLKTRAVRSAKQGQNTEESGTFSTVKPMPVGATRTWSLKPTRHAAIYLVAEATKAEALTRSSRAVR